MRHLFAVMALLFLFIVTSCGDFEGKKSTSQIDRISSYQLQDYITVQVQPTTKPERYMVYFGWPRIEDQKKIRIRKDQTLASISPNQTTFSHEVDHNQTITYSFDVLDSSDKVEKTFSKLVVIPRDFVVRKEQNSFSDNTKLNINRLFIEASESLVTNGFNVEIQTKELHATNGIIETIPQNTQAKPDSDGKSGGTLTINAQTATGTLKIFMRGENGGDGSKGDEFPNRAPQGSRAGTGTPVMDPDQPGHCSCFDVGAPGGPGLPGSKGNKGHPGKKGGNSGILKLSIKDGSALSVETFAIPGTAGKKGPGGNGQLGGLGGDGKTGLSSCHDGCLGDQGPDGPQGPPGEDGDPGVDGNKDEICVYIESEGKNDCF